MKTTKTKYPKEITRKQYYSLLHYISEYIGSEDWEFGDEVIGVDVDYEDSCLFDEAFFDSNPTISMYPVKYIQRNISVDDQFFNTRTLFRKWWDSLVDKT